MDFLSQTHIRVSKPLTTDGLNPKVDDFGRIQYKTTHLPLTAKRQMEQISDRLPKHLKYRIEVIEVSHKVELPEEPRRGRPKKQENEEN